jgi:hypothetical protein
MPLFEVEEAGTLVPFRQLLGGAELYESEIEDLLWSNLEEFTGEALFRVRRQPTLAGGGRPDIVILDSPRGSCCDRGQTGRRPRPARSVP